MLAFHFRKKQTKHPACVAPQTLECGQRAPSPPSRAVSSRGWRSRRGRPQLAAARRCCSSRTRQGTIARTCRSRTRRGRRGRPPEPFKRRHAPRRSRKQRRSPHASPPQVCSCPAPSAARSALLTPPTAPFTPLFAPLGRPHVRILAHGAPAGSQPLPARGSPGAPRPSRSPTRTLGGRGVVCFRPARTALPRDRTGACTWGSRRAAGSSGLPRAAAEEGGARRQWAPTGVGRFAAAAPPLIEALGAPRPGARRGGGARRGRRPPSSRSRLCSPPAEALADAGFGPGCPGL